MKQTGKPPRSKRVLTGIRRYLTFFLFMAFILTSCILLFAEQLGLSASLENMQNAAVYTLGNVLFLSLLCAVADGIRRRYMVERPVRRIIAATERITKGDFSVRIQPMGGAYTVDGFDAIIANFNKMAEELSGVEALRTDFIANVSHELKTPLAVMQNCGTLLAQPDLPEEKRIEYAKTVTESSRRLADLITNILKLNRLENQQIYPEKNLYNLGEQLCECLLSFERTWEEKDIAIETDIAEDVYIDSDAALLTLVWNNLFSNALKFTPQGGTVSLRLQEDGAFAVVEVRDTGCGISPEVGGHIFEKFYQGDTSHATQGNGLGLALVKRVVDIVGGEIFVSSEVGVGSSFTVKIRRTEHGKMVAES